MIIFSSSTQTFRPVFPAPETAAWFNNWRFGIAVNADKNFGFVEENVFTCPTCKRELPTAFAQADHIFPQKALRYVLDDLLFSYSNWETFSDVAASANKCTFTDDDTTTIRLGKSRFRLPDYDNLDVYSFDNWDGGYDEIKQIANNKKALKNARYSIGIKDIRINDFADNAVSVWNDNTLTFYYDLARYDVTNLVFLCSVCNHAKSERIFPAHKYFVTKINQQTYLGHITNNNYGSRFLDDNTGPTYCEQRDLM